MSPRSSLKADRYSADQLLLKVSDSYDPRRFDLTSYDEFIDAVVGGRQYQREAVGAVLRLFCGGRYEDTTALARESFDGQSELQRFYTSADRLVDRLPFPLKLSASLDLATGTGKSYAMYAVARVMLNEGLIDRVLVLCPSTTIESGLWEKFSALTAESDLTNLLPARSNGHAIPTIVDAGATVQVGDICIENRHAAYERTGSSLRDSFIGVGDKTLVISDEAHHLASAGGESAKKWHEFVTDADYGFRYHLGVSGTCYVQNEYFADVIYRYSIREAINDGWIKDVFYLTEDDSTTDDERFQKLFAQHEKNRRAYAPLKPLTVAVSKDIKAAEQLASDLESFLAKKLRISARQAASRVLLVTSASQHRANVAKLRRVDGAGDPVEWIVSVSMLTEGWDVHNVFQIYPHEKRAFNSKLLISQVLGRGLRRPEGVTWQPTVFVFNHQKWGAEIQDFVAEVLDRDTTIWQRPAARASAPHFVVHDLVREAVPQEVIETPLIQVKRLTSLRLSPQMDAEEQTKFVSITDESRASILTTRVVERRYPTDEVVEDVRQRLLGHDRRTGGSLAREYPKLFVKRLLIDALRAVGADPGDVSQENRQRVLNSFGGLRQRTAVSGARLVNKAVGVRDVSTSLCRPTMVRIAELARASAVFIDEESPELGTDDDKAALVKIDEMLDPKNVVDVQNSFDFKSPTNIVITDHQPEQRFARRLFQRRNAQEIESWLKGPDTGFYEIEYGYQEGGAGWTKRGMFNPDFFVLLNNENVAICEVKSDGDATWRNLGKFETARAHVAELNEFMASSGVTRRYTFHMISPRDYDKFFEALRSRGLVSFRSGLEAQLTALTRVSST